MNTTQSATPTAELVRNFRAQVAADPELYDGDTDVAMWLLEHTNQRTWSPSEMGRALGLDTVSARRILIELAGLGVGIVATGNGAWTRYQAA